MSAGLRLILFDRTCVNRAGLGLSRAWNGGARLYRGLGRADGSFGARSFGEAFRWLSSFRSDRPISELQFWGHGKWGRVFVRGESLDRSALVAGHEHHLALSALRERMTGDALFWFRSCETFGAMAGHDFARAWTDFFGCPAAGHTFIIGFWQSGLHLLRPGSTPFWPANEGLLGGSPALPERAAISRPGRPNTVSCLIGRVPDGW
jgi:hypothetical protein